VEVGATGHAIRGGTMWFPLENESTSANRLEKRGEMRLPHSDYRTIFRSDQKDFPNAVRIRNAVLILLFVRVPCCCS